VASAPADTLSEPHSSHSASTQAGAEHANARRAPIRQASHARIPPRQTQFRTNTAIRGAARDDSSRAGRLPAVGTTQGQTVSRAARGARPRRKAGIVAAVNLRRRPTRSARRRLAAGPAPPWAARAAGRHAGGQAGPARASSASARATTGAHAAPAEKPRGGLQPQGTPPCPGVLATTHEQRRRLTRRAPPHEPADREFAPARTAIIGDNGWPPAAAQQRRRAGVEMREPRDHQAPAGSPRSRTKGWRAMIARRGVELHTPSAYRPVASHAFWSWVRDGGDASCVQPHSGALLPHRSTREGWLTTRCDASARGADAWLPRNLSGSAAHSGSHSCSHRRFGRWATRARPASRSNVVEHRHVATAR